MPASSSDCGFRPLGTIVRLLLLVGSASLAATGMTGPVRPPASPQLPLRFEPNLGQWRSTLTMVGRGPGYLLLLQRDGVRVSSAGMSLAMQWVGGNLRTRAVGVRRWPGFVSEFQGRRRARWQTRIPVYHQARVPAIYPGVDLWIHRPPARAAAGGRLPVRPAPASRSRLRSPVGVSSLPRFEFDLRLAAGASPRPIDLRFPGARLRWDRHGGLWLSLHGAVLHFGRPLAWQSTPHGRRTIACRFRLLHRDAIGFICQRVDAARPLTIDPVVRLARYLGGSGSDQGAAVAVDASGDIFVAGSTQSPDLAGAGGYQGLTDAFVVKLDPTGATVLSATYLGGSSEDDATAIALAPDGSVYLTGATLSWNFPVTSSAFQRSLGGNYDAFVIHLSSDGSQLLYSTYLGGTNVDWGNAIAVDGEGHAVVAGYTLSPDFPVVDPVQSRYGGGARDAFLTRMSRDGSRVLDSTWIGGSGDDVAFALALDNQQNILVAGSTTSTDFPVTSGASQTRFAGGSCQGTPCSAGFLASFSPDASALNWSSYVGGTGSTVLYGIAADGSGDIWTAGATTAPDLPLPPGGWQPSVSTLGCGVGLCHHGFVLRWKPDGSALTAGTYLSGSGDDFLTAVQVIAQGQAVVLAGQTASPDFPLTPAAVQSSLRGSEAGLISILDPVLGQLWFSTYWGGSASTAARAVAITPANEVVVTGVTDSPDLPQSLSGAQDAYQGSGDAFLAAIDPAPVFQNQPGSLDFGPQRVGTASAPLTLTLTNAGILPLQLSGVQVQGDFNFTGNCPEWLNSQQQCALQVVFHPSVRGTRNGMLSFTDNTPDSPQTVALSGKGITPIVALSPAQLTFPAVDVGSTTPPQTFTLSNTGDASLDLSAVTYTGDFSGKSTCGASLEPSANCTVTVTFTPTAAGTRTGSIAFTDDAADTPQSVPLQGDGMDFSLGANPSGESVTPGGDTQFTVTLTPQGGFQETVHLACSGAPSEATCTPGTASVPLDGVHPASQTISVSTTAPSLSPPPHWPRRRQRPLLLLPVLLLLLLWWTAPGDPLTGWRRRRAAACLLALALLTGCGGGGGPAVAPPANPGTPAGSYTLTIAATEGNLQHSATVTLKIQ